MYEIADLHKDITKGMSLLKVHKKYGGFSIYIPKVQGNYKDEVLKEFNGYNQAFLATKYNVSLNTIYKIVREHKSENK